MLHANFMAMCFPEPELLPIEVLHCRNRDFRPFCSYDLDLDPMTFIYELDLWPLEIYWLCENKLPTSRLLKVIVLQTYVHTDRQTMRTYIGLRPRNYTTPLRGWSTSRPSFTHKSCSYESVYDCTIVVHNTAQKVLLILSLIPHTITRHILTGPSRLLQLVPRTARQRQRHYMLFAHILHTYCFKKYWC